MKKQLVTGASASIGAALCQGLTAGDIPFAPCVRKTLSILRPGTAMFETGDLSRRVDWTPALAGWSVIVHLASGVRKSL